MLTKRQQLDNRSCSLYVPSAISEKNMANQDGEIEEKSAELQAFEYYMRTGWTLPPSRFESAGERKFNPYHDPDDGRFTFGPGGGQLSPRASSSSAARMGPVDDFVRWMRGTPTAAVRPKPAPSPSSTTAPSPKAPAVKVPQQAPATRTAARPAPWRHGGVMSPRDVETRADHAMGQFRENRARGMTVEEAAAWAANSEIESVGDHRLHQIGGGPGRGLYQWGSDKVRFDRRIAFRKVIKVEIENSTREQQYQFRDWELTVTERPAKARIDAAVSAGDKAHAISSAYLRPFEKERQAAERSNLAEAIARRAK
jgi:hypothetical protein